MLFYIIGVLTENLITARKTLWLIHFSFWNDFLVDYFIGYFIFSSIILVFLSNYPKQKIKQLLYTLTTGSVLRCFW